MAASTNLANRVKLGHVRECRESTGHWWIPLTKDRIRLHLFNNDTRPSGHISHPKRASLRASNAELWCFFVVSLNELSNKQSNYCQFEMAMTDMWHHLLPLAGCIWQSQCFPRRLEGQEVWFSRADLHQHRPHIHPIAWGGGIQVHWEEWKYADLIGHVSHYYPGALSFISMG